MARGTALSDDHARPGQPRRGQPRPRLGRLTNVLHRDFHIEQITGADKTVDVVVDIFNRVNSGGTKLSKGDLALARICSEWDQARPWMRTHLDRWAGQGYSLTLDWILRNITAVATGRAPFSSLEDVSATDFEHALHAAVRHIDHLLGLAVERLGIDHDRVLFGRYAFPVLVRILSHRADGRFASGPKADRALAWYVHAALRGRFTGPTETNLNKDLQIADAEGIDGLLRSPTKLQKGSLAIRAEDFEGVGRGARSYPLLYLLTRSEAARPRDRSSRAPGAHRQGPARARTSADHRPAPRRAAARPLGGRIQPEANLHSRLALVRQLAEAVKYAHEHRLVHRALSPHAIVVEDAGNGPRLRVGEWQVAARGLSSRRTAHRVEPTSHAGNHVEATAQGYIAPEFTNVADGTVALDVFGVGAVAHLLLTGVPPCVTRQDLFERLAREDGFRPTTDDPTLPPAVDELVALATTPKVSGRHSDLDEFLEFLAAIESEAAGDTIGTDPFEARPGDELPGGYRVTKVLGRGASSTGILVEHRGLPSVLKVGRSAEADERLEAEAIALHDLTHDHVVVLKQGMFPVGRRSAIELSHAGDRTLAQVLAAGALDRETLEALGRQLLDAVAYIHRRDTVHRDIKPDNLGLHQHHRRGQQLTLFDFSLAGTSTKGVLTGTFGYRDPHLGSADRPEYDTAADLYSVAATLHEMASGDVPIWGDDGTDPRFVDAVTLSSDLFDPSLHDGLVAFFTTALRKDPRQRHPDAEAMRAAWHEVFHGRPPAAPAPGPYRPCSADGDRSARRARRRPCRAASARIRGPRGRPRGGAGVPPPASSAHRSVRRCRPLDAHADRDQLAHRGRPHARAG